MSDIVQSIRDAADIVEAVVAERDRLFLENTDLLHQVATLTAEHVTASTLRSVQILEASYASVCDRLEQVKAERDRALQERQAAREERELSQTTAVDLRVEIRQLREDLVTQAQGHKDQVKRLLAERDAAQAAVADLKLWAETLRQEREAARRERDEVRAEVIPMLEDSDRWKTACIAAHVDHTTESYKAINALAGRETAAREAVARASETMHRALHELTFGVAGNPIASAVPRASDILRDGIARLAL